METLSRTSLTKVDQWEAAYLLTDAFWDNPAHSFIYPDAATRFQSLNMLMFKNLNAQFTVGQSFAFKSSQGRIVAMGFWHAPGAPKATLFQIIRFGFLGLYIKQGKDAFTRIVKITQEMEQRRAQALEGRDSWYLNNMVVALSCRGKGIGGRLMRSQLEYIVEPSGQPASLTTQKYENVRFYQALGFQVKDDRPISDGQAEFQNWIMVREADGA